MFTFILCKWLKLENEEARIAMIIMAMIGDFLLTAMILEGLGIIMVV